MGSTCSCVNTSDNKVHPLNTDKHDNDDAAPGEQVAEAAKVNPVHMPSAENHSHMPGLYHKRDPSGTTFVQRSIPHSRTTSYAQHSRGPTRSLSSFPGAFGLSRSHTASSDSNWRLESLAQVAASEHRRNSQNSEGTSGPNTIRLAETNTAGAVPSTGFKLQRPTSLHVNLGDAGPDIPDPSPLSSPEQKFRVIHIQPKPIALPISLLNQTKNLNRHRQQPNHMHVSSVETTTSYQPVASNPVGVRGPEPDMDSDSFLETWSPPLNIPTHFKEWLSDKTLKAQQKGQRVICEDCGRSFRNPVNVETHFFCPAHFQIDQEPIPSPTSSTFPTSPERPEPRNSMSGCIGSGAISSPVLIPRQGEDEKSV